MWTQKVHKCTNCPVDRPWRPPSLSGCAHICLFSYQKVSDLVTDQPSEVKASSRQNSISAERTQQHGSYCKLSHACDYKLSKLEPSTARFTTLLLKVRISAFKLETLRLKFWILASLCIPSLGLGYFPRLSPWTVRGAEIVRLRVLLLRCSMQQRRQCSACPSRLHARKSGELRPSESVRMIRCWIYTLVALH